MTLNAANNWRYTWEKLPEHNRNGSKVAWSAAEKELAGYTVCITQDGVTFTVTKHTLPMSRFEKPVAGR